MRRKVSELENAKIDLETEAERFKAISDLNRKQAKEKEDALFDIEEDKEKMLVEISQLKEKEKTLVARFQTFAEEVSKLKQTNSTISEELRASVAAVAAKDAVIKQMSAFGQIGVSPLGLNESEASPAKVTEPIVTESSPVGSPKMKKSASKKKLTKPKKGKKGEGKRNEASEASMKSGVKDGEGEIDAATEARLRK